MFPLLARIWNITTGIVEKFLWLRWRDSVAKEYIRAYRQTVSKLRFLPSTALLPAGIGQLKLGSN